MGQELEAVVKKCYRTCILHYGLWVLVSAPLLNPASCECTPWAWHMMTQVLEFVTRESWIEFLTLSLSLSQCQFL